jgi:PhnB protein
VPRFCARDKVRPCKEDSLADAEIVEVPEGYARVNAWVISRDTDAEIAFLGAVFGAEEREGSRFVNPDGTIGHVEVFIGDAVLLMFDQRPEWSPMPAALRVYAGDVDATVERAVTHGARVVTRPTELAFGERVARVRDPQGHLWWIHQRLQAVEPDEMMRRFGEPAFQEAMTYVQASLADELASSGSDEDG